MSPSGTKATMTRREAGRPLSRQVSGPSNGEVRRYLGFSWPGRENKRGSHSRGKAGSRGFRHGFRLGARVWSRGFPIIRCRFRLRPHRLHVELEHLRSLVGLGFQFFSVLRCDLIRSQHRFLFGLVVRAGIRRDRVQELLPVTATSATYWEAAGLLVTDASGRKSAVWGPSTAVRQTVGSGS
jgi:hypothetical protein